MTFGCNDPFVIDGHETLRCVDGTWSNKLPICGGLFLCAYAYRELENENQSLHANEDFQKIQE